MAEWTLYKRPVNEYANEYAWVDPEGVIRHNRVIAPYGWTLQYVCLVGISLKSVQYDADPKFRKVLTQMTQDQLSKGWLC